MRNLFTIDLKDYCDTDVIYKRPSSRAIIIKDGKMYGRGTLDMKAFAAVAMNSMHYVLENELDVKLGIILSTDEEKGSKSTHAFMNKYPNTITPAVMTVSLEYFARRPSSITRPPLFVFISISEFLLKYNKGDF